MMVRDPISSAISRKMIWNIPPEQSFKMALSFSRNSDKIGEACNIKRIYFEDLVNNTESTLDSIERFTGSKDLKADGLIGQDGKPYRRETSDLGLLRKSGVEHSFIDPSVAFKTSGNDLYMQYKERFKDLSKTSLYSRYF